MEKSNVYFQKLNKAYYPKRSPFHPSKIYPEYPFKEISKEKNVVYDLFRNLLHLMGLDKENWKTERWNPFKNIIFPGNRVLIKPNLVKENSRIQDCITTHPSIIRVIVDYVFIALKGKGEIIIGDAPLQKCDFDKLIETTGLEKTIDFYKSKEVDINLIDFRTEKLVSKSNSIFTLLTQNKKKIKTEKLSGDPRGYTIVDLKNCSNLQDLSLDLNQILIYTKKDGTLSNKKQRIRLYFCDCIISGENDGPLDPTPKKTKILIKNKYLSKYDLNSRKIL